MMRSALIGRPFATLVTEHASPVWGPLEAVASVARSRCELPPFHEGEFMYMAAVRSRRALLRIHLYKHVDTRCYLNLDDDGNAYAYCGSLAGTFDRRSGGTYQRYRALVHAIEHLDLWLFEIEPRFTRSFPPDMWPEVGGASAVNRAGEASARRDFEDAFPIPENPFPAAG